MKKRKTSFAKWISILLQFQTARGGGCGVAGHSLVPEWDIASRFCSYSCCRDFSEVSRLFRVLLVASVGNLQTRRLAEGRWENKIWKNTVNDGPVNGINYACCVVPAQLPPGNRGWESGSPLVRLVESEGMKPQSGNGINGCWRWSSGRSSNKMLPCWWSYRNAGWFMTVVYAVATDRTTIQHRRPLGSSFLAIVLAHHDCDCERCCSGWRIKDLDCVYQLMRQGVGPHYQLPRFVICTTRWR